jgi:hypothetical protein
MPLWAYQMSSLYVALVMVASIEVVSLLGLFLVRRLLLPHLRFHDGVNDAISGTVQAIGVFYGITVGLIAVGVWNTNSNASDLVSKEAASIGALYRDVSGYPAPVRDELQSRLREYTHFVIEQAWPAQRQGRILDGSTRILDNFQNSLMKFEPSTPGQTALHSETLRAYNVLIGYRRQRIDAVGSGLSQVMWMVIWIGAAISIGVAYLYKIDDPKLHAILVALMAGFLAMVIFMIVINDRPFSGKNGIPPDSYKLILDKLIELDR